MKQSGVVINNYILEITQSVQYKLYIPWFYIKRDLCHITAEVNFTVASVSH